MQLLAVVGVQVQPGRLMHVLSDVVLQLDAVPEQCAGELTVQSQPVCASQLVELEWVLQLLTVP